MNSSQVHERLGHHAPNSSAGLRSRFQRFFEQRGHTIVPSASLIPGTDPTLLFTNAGMVPFKDVFLGQEQRDYRRAVSAQRCVRAGGKHNDLENVGYTARHHTFFEMLGNFSFGDYFKRDAIRFAWAFLTEEIGLPANRLWVTVYEEDDEAAAIWLDEIGVPVERFSRIGAKDNFWSMGDTGPCGPCTEIFYDHGPSVPGGPPGTPEEDGDRYIEIWNLVFMQYDRAADGTLTPLPSPCVDTGMGLERLAAVVQGVHSNFEIDLFEELIDAAARATATTDRGNSSLRVIADHIRACAFLIVDGVVPGNEGRGYVLRRIVRRAVRHGYKLGQQQPFFHQLVDPLVAVMGDAYPELRDAAPHVAAVLLREERQFHETLELGLGLLDEVLGGLEGGVIPGETIFRLYDTFGFPVDLTGDIARERGLTLDMDGFERCMTAQRERARAASRFRSGHGDALQVDHASTFSGYDTLADHGEVTALFRDGAAVDALAPGERGVVVLDRTPFYAESGGQVGDTGRLLGEGNACFLVEDTQRYGAAHGHLGVVEAGGRALTIGDRLRCEVDAQRREAIVLHHSSTHLLHAALRQVLGKHVTQKGSLVAPDRLRFDFSHPEPVSSDELQRIERLVNDWVRTNVEGESRTMPFDQAIAAGALALFGEKYGDEVRVLRFGEHSTELCGGTHVRRTGDIGVFKIVSESGVASGIRRIEAMSGACALDHVAQQEQRLQLVSSRLKISPDQIESRIDQLLERQRTAEKELQRLRQRLASGGGGASDDDVVEVAGVKVVARALDGADPAALRNAVDGLKQRLGSAAIVLAAVDDGRIRLVAGVTDDLVGRLPAGELVNAVASRVGGKGGGRADLAQAGGNQPDLLPAALANVPDWVRSRLG